MKYIQKLGLVIIFLMFSSKAMEEQHAQRNDTEESYRNAIEAIECFMKGTLEAHKENNDVFITYQKDQDHCITYHIIYFLELMDYAQAFDSKRFKERAKDGYYKSLPDYIFSYDIQFMRLKDFLETMPLNQETSFEHALKKIKELKEQKGDQFLKNHFKTDDIYEITQQLIFRANNRYNYVSFFKGSNEGGINELARTDFLHFVFIPLAHYKEQLKG